MGRLASAAQPSEDVKSAKGMGTPRLAARVTEVEYSGRLVQGSRGASVTANGV